MNGSVEGQYSVMVSWLLENRLENLILPSFLLRTEKSLDKWATSIRFAILFGTEG